MRAFTIAILAAALCAMTAQAWWCTGHMVVAQIAWENLDSDVQSQVSQLFSSMSKNGPFPMSPDLMQAGCWADDLKSDKLVSMASWHFINQVYAPTSYKPTQSPLQEENVETVIAQLEKTGKEQHKIQWIQTFAVANLVHFIGDIHQPLHATELFTQQFPDGDQGGNLYHVNYNGQSTHLHFVWDSVCEQWTDELQRPLNDVNRTWIQQTAKTLMAQYNVSSESQRVWNSTVMAQESYQYAVSTAYGLAPAPGGDITQDYLNACIPVAQRRIVEAGYRLGNELNYIFKDARSKSEEEVAHGMLKRLNKMGVKGAHNHDHHHHN